MRNKVLTILCFAVLTAALLSGCGKKKEEANATEVSSEIPEEMEGEEEETREDIEEEPVQIEQEDADQLLSEKLEGIKGIEAVYNDLMTIDEEDYYTYTVVTEDNEELDQMLAVNAVSGEIFVYDFENDVISDYSNFVYYDPERDDAVSWDGSFVLGDRVISLLPEDDTSFEFTIRKNDETELVGTGLVEGRKATYSDDQVSLIFEMEGKVLKVTDEGNMSGFAGLYDIVSGDDKK